MRKGFIVRDRSLSSLPSKQLSVHELSAENSKVRLISIVDAAFFSISRLWIIENDLW